MTFLSGDAKSIVRMVNRFAAGGLHVSPTIVCPVQDAMKGERTAFDVDRIYALANDMHQLFLTTPRYDEFTSNSSSLVLDMRLANRVICKRDDPYVSHGEAILALYLAGFKYRFVAGASHCLIRCKLHAGVRARIEKPEDYTDEESDK